MDQVIGWLKLWHIGRGPLTGAVLTHTHSMVTCYFPFKSIMIKGKCNLWSVIAANCEMPRLYNHLHSLRTQTNICIKCFDAMTIIWVIELFACCLNYKDVFGAKSILLKRHSTKSDFRQNLKKAKFAKRQYDNPDGRCSKYYWWLASEIQDENFMHWLNGCWLVWFCGSLTYGCMWGFYQEYF